MTDTTAIPAADRTASPPWRRLLVVTPVGWALGIMAGVGLVVLAESLGLQGIQTPLVLGVAVGVSVQQFRALAPMLGRQGRQWVLVSCFGLASPFIIADIALMGARPLPYDLTNFVILGGVVVSVLQWGMLRTAVGRAGGWLIASPAGYLAAAGTVWLNERVIPKTPGLVGALQYLAVIFAGGVLLGAFTAVAAARFSVPPASQREGWRVGRTVSSLPWNRLMAEFTVIVAGVLIALAVDSWWERQQERNQAREYLEQLLVDIEVTERRLHSTIETETQRLEGVNTVIGRALHGPWPPADSLDLPTGYNYFEPLKGTLTALMQSGDLRLLRSDAIRMELIAFAALLHETETILRHTETMIWNSTERVTVARARHSQSAARRGANAGRGWGQVDVAGALNDPEIISALQLQAAASQMRLFNLGRLEEPTSRIVALLRAELD